MKLKKLLILLCLPILAACSRADKAFKETAIEAEAEVGAYAQIDSLTAFRLDSYDIRENDGNKELIITYSIRSKADPISTSFDLYRLKAQQEGIDLVPSLDLVDEEKLVATLGEDGEIGGLSQGFILKDDSPVDILVKGTDTAFIKDSKPVEPYPVKITIKP